MEELEIQTVLFQKKYSEDMLLNRIEDKYGKNYYGDWSRSQMPGCIPSPTSGMSKMLLKRFTVTYVDEFRTSVTCNRCENRLVKYRKKTGTLSHSRLCCETCGLKQKRSKKFLDRDLNAAANILWIGTSPERPSCLSRHPNKPSVGAEGASSDPSLMDDSESLLHC